MAADRPAWAADDELPILNTLREGDPSLVEGPDALARSITTLSAGSGPLAVDTERAHGFRYAMRAYLLQFKRSGAGIHLIDPLTLGDDPVAALAPLNQAMARVEWIIHAAPQDLPCLRMAGLYPSRLFDTELAARLLGLPRVGLSSLVEHYCGQRLLKEHSAANWSSRPIPDDWLLYAALDVELLIELRGRLHDDLEEAGKLEWARQECDHVLGSFATAPEPRPDPWRRTSGINRVSTPRGMAVVRELWTARDVIAAELDLAPGKLLQDQAISELASRITTSSPAPSRQDIRSIEGFRRRRAQRYETTWLNALHRVAQMSRGDYPPMRGSNPDGIGQPRSWQRHRPQAWARWSRARPAVNELADSLHLPPENLISPEALKRIVHDPPATLSEDSVAEALSTHQVRPWQQELVAPVLVSALRG